MGTNWIQVVGNYCEINDREIIYHAPVRHESHDKEEISQKMGESYGALIRASSFFETGTVQFTFSVSEPNAIVSIGIGDLVIGTNSIYSTSLYSIRRYVPGNTTPEVLSAEGMKGTLAVNTDYKFAVKVDGSNVTFYINDVIVGKVSSLIKREQLELTFLSYQDIKVRDFFVSTKRPKVFVVMQFTNEYNELYNDVIKKVTEDFGYDCIRADEFYQSSLILTDIIDSIKEASIIIADITPDNPNVFYEVGYAHALNKPTILLSDKKREKLPFDVSGFRTLFYDNTIGGKNRVEEKLKKHLEHLTQS